MACDLSRNNPSSLLPSLPSIKTSLVLLHDRNLSVKRCVSYGRRSKTVACSAILNLPLEPRSPAGKSLIGVLQNEPSSFYDAVSEELNRVADDQDDAVLRMNLGLGSRDVEASLHRRIAKIKEDECRIAVEDIMYMIILYKFSEIRVPLVPKLCKCLYNGRLEILPSKDWELESVHSVDVLEMIREHLTNVLGWKAGSSVAVNWSTTGIQRCHVSQVYTSSISFGYFLKSASLRHHLERSLTKSAYDIPFRSSLENHCLGQMAPATPMSFGISSALGKNNAKLQSYVMGSDPQMLRVCAKFKSEGAISLVEKHCLALFEDDNTTSNGMILTSLSSLKRLVLEAVAFGCFLWDAEEHVDRVYRLRD